MKLEYIDVPVSDWIDAPLPWQEKGLMETATGYGMKLTSTWKVKYRGRLYRVYYTCISNAASHWITRRGKKLHVRWAGE